MEGVCTEDAGDAGVLVMQGNQTLVKFTIFCEILQVSKKRKIIWSEFFWPTEPYNRVKVALQLSGNLLPCGESVLVILQIMQLFLS